MLHAILKSIEIQRSIIQREVTTAFSNSYDINNPDKINREERQERENKWDFFAFFAGLAVQRVCLILT